MGNFPGGSFPREQLSRGMGNFTRGQLPRRQLSGEQSSRGKLGSNYLGDNFPRGQFSRHPFKNIYCFQNSLKLIKTFSSVSENNTVVNIIVQTIKGSRKNWGIIFFSVEFKILTRKNGVFLNSVQEFIEIEELAASDLFHMFTKPVKYYIFHCHILKSSGVHQIERSGCSFQ